MSEIEGKFKWSLGCWEWTGYVGNKGYGLLPVPGTRSSTTAHRMSYEIYVGEIPPLHHVHHACGNRLCVNPNHLEAVLVFEHGSRDAQRRKRQIARER